MGLAPAANSPYFQIPVLTTRLGSADMQLKPKKYLQYQVKSSAGNTVRVTLGADKAYDARAFVHDLLDLNITPPVAQSMSNRATAIDGLTTRHPGYAISQQKRKRTEEPFGWAKPSAGSPGPCYAEPRDWDSSSF